MSKIFYDHLIEIEIVKLHIDKVTTTHEEKEDLWNLVDEFVNHKIISSILSELDETSQDEFLSMFFDKPYDTEIINYLNEKLPLPLENLITGKMKLIINELCETLEIQPIGNAQESVKKKSGRKSKK